MLRGLSGDAEVLDVAVRVFASCGFERANLDEIAALARTTTASVLERFGTKEQLYASAAQREYGLRTEALFAAYEHAGDGDFGDHVHRWVSAYFTFVRQRPAGFRLLTEAERHPASAATILVAQQQIVDRIARLIKEVSHLRADSGPRVMASMIVGLLTSTANAAMNQTDREFNAAAAMCESFLLAGLRGVDRQLIYSVRR